MGMNFGASPVFVTSYNQSGGITAHTVNVAPAARRFDSGHASQLKGILPVGAKVSVTAVMGDQEAFGFASEVDAWLRSAGYVVDGVNQAIFSKPVTGQGVEKVGDEYRLVIGSQAR
jgi:hypothetical protein